MNFRAALLFNVTLKQRPHGSRRRTAGKVPPSCGSHDARAPTRLICAASRAAARRGNAARRVFFGPRDIRPMAAPVWRRVVARKDDVARARREEVVVYGVDVAVSAGPSTGRAELRTARRRGHRRLLVVADDFAYNS